MILTKENIKKIDLDFLVQEKITSNRIHELLLIVPTNRKARTLKKEIISLMPARSAHGINIETIGTLSTKLLKKSAAIRQLSEAASTVFIKQSASEIKLRYFSLYKKEIPFGTLDRIRNIISEYKRNGITPVSIRKEAEGLSGSEQLKADDIADIYERYLEKCGRLNAFEIGDVYIKLNNLPCIELINNFQSLFPDTDLVIVNGFDEFTLPEHSIIDTLAKNKRAKLFLNFDYNENNNFIFSHLDKCFRRFIDSGFRIVIDQAEERLNSFRKTVRNELFKIRGKKKVLSDKEKIIKFSAFNRESEIETISKEIKKLIVEEKVEPHKICVVFNLIQNYSLIVRDVFEKNGIPYNLTDRISLDNSNPVTAVINYLEIAENDFYFKNIFRALTGGFIENGDIDFSNLLKVSSELKIVSGRNNWFSSLNDAIESRKYYSGIDESEQGKQIESYKKALVDLNGISLLLKPFEDKLTVSEFLKRLFDFLYKSGIGLRLLSSANNSEENIRGFSTFIDTLNEVFDLMQEEYGTERKFHLHFFMEQIRTACGWARFNVKEKSNYGVQITTLEEIRGLQYDYVFIGGLCDGDLPTRYSPEIFTLPSFKKRAIEHQAQERNLFYQTLIAWNKKIFLSFPATESGRETVESSFLKDFELLFETGTINDEVNNKLICSKEDFEIEIGSNGDELMPGDFLQSDYDYNEIEKAISVEKKREEDPLCVSGYTGFLLDDDVEMLNPESLEILKSYANRQYSISQLEMYAKCPFKFFVERILKIDTIEEPSEDIEAMEMGNILHNILFQFYTRLRELSINLNSCNSETLEHARKLLNQIAYEEISITNFKSPLTFYEKEKIFGIGGNEKESILNRFIEYECENNNDFSPSYFEVRFGSITDESSDSVLSDSKPVTVEGIKLKGKIDRIDVSNTDDTFNIIDYKLSGKKPSFRELKEGVSLQLPVYLYASSQLLKRKFGRDFSPEDMIIYSLKYSEDEFGKIKVVSGDSEIKDSSQLIKLTMQHIRDYVQRITEGKFGLSNREDRETLVCRYCNFKSVCRINSIIA
ncbi:MAG TPA: exodeoxyribonuclease V subunit gamma [Melioribacteraceae bacterium]|nr:exodeoxyribonuclease V subunit gamma [Melioribacteraceae bacterium]